MRNVVAELHGEKIDIIDWDADAATPQLAVTSSSPAHAKVVRGRTRLIAQSEFGWRFRTSPVLPRSPSAAEGSETVALLRASRAGASTSTATPRARAPQKTSPQLRLRSSRIRSRLALGSRVHNGRTNVDGIRINADGATSPDSDMYRVSPAGSGHRVAPRCRSARVRSATDRPGSAASSIRSRRMVAPRSGMFRTRRAAPGLRPGTTCAWTGRPDSGQ